LNETSSPVRLLLVVAAALVDADGRVLLAQRPPGKQLAGLWEFPGGKIDAGERPEQALARELGEELGIDACVSCMQPLAFASHAYEDFHLLMPLFVCGAGRARVAAGRAGAALGAPARLAQIPDAARRRAADRPADRAARLVFSGGAVFLR